MSTLILLVAATLGAGPTPPIGTAIPDLDLADGQGRVVCVVFLKAGCPVAELYATPLAEIADQFGPKGVAFVGVASEQDDPAMLARFAAEHRIGFPILQDSGDLATRLGAERTPEVVVLDRQGRIRYRGRIDDRYAVGSKRDAAQSHDLIDALEDLLGGREVARPETEPVGCPIDRPATSTGSAGATYCRDIAPILDRRCASCHRAGEIGPFPLRTYREVTARAGAIAEAVEDRRMPPWHADPRFGKFANDARLTDRERDLIVGWSRNGRPEGNPADLPKPIDRPTGWRLAQPDLVVSMPSDYTVPAQGVVDYQTFEVDPGFREDRWIKGAEIRAGNRKVVHHCNVFLKAPGSRSKADAQGDLGSVCLAMLTPGTPPLTLPEGMAKRIPAGWRLVFVVHYAPIGVAQEDRTSIGLRFADPASVRKEVATNLMLDPDLKIPPREPNHRVEKARRFEDDVLLLAMFPHMHLRGKSFRYEATFPDGRTETLLEVPRYDFAWQDRYELESPRFLPAGTTLRCIAHFDNSSENPANPDPDATVLAGQQSWEEMFNGYYEFALADQDLTRPPTPLEALRKTLKRFSTPAFPLGFAACALSGLLILRGRRRHSGSCRIAG